MHRRLRLLLILLGAALVAGGLASVGSSIDVHRLIARIHAPEP